MLAQIKLLTMALALGIGSLALAQDDPAPVTPPAAPADKPESTPPTTDKDDSSTFEKLEHKGEALLNQGEEKVKEIAEKVDHDPRAQKALAGILQPIYLVAEKLAFPAFHWLAFALMSAGVFSYTLQLLLGKLVVLLRYGFSIKEIASDAVALAISVVGLVLTTQAAAENSTFTQSPAAVISATVVGGLAGIVLYFWGQAQELEAVAGRTRQMSPKKK